MTISNRYDTRLIAFTGGHEGKVLKWYRDPTGTPTIGFGFTWSSKVFRDWFQQTRGRKMRAGDTITEAEALMLLKLTIETEYLPPVLVEIGRANASVSRHAISAAADMSYNCGKGALNWSWFKALLAGNTAEAAKRYRVTARTSKGRTLPGLVRRRKEGAQILQLNIWPTWLKTVAPISTVEEVKAALPAWRLPPEDFDQGLIWLRQLGYFDGLLPTGETDAVRAAVLAFQKEHPQLTDDGILGRATLDQLQRVIDLKRKAKTTGVAGGAPASAGGAEAATQTDVTGISDILIWGGVAVIVIGGAWLAWRYRDELSIAVRSLFQGKGKRT